MRRRWMTRGRMSLLASRSMKLWREILGRSDQGMSRWRMVMFSSWWWLWRVPPILSWQWETCHFWIVAPDFWGFDCKLVEKKKRWYNIHVLYIDLIDTTKKFFLELATLPFELHTIHEAITKTLGGSSYNKAGTVDRQHWCHQTNGNMTRSVTGQDRVSTWCSQIIDECLKDTGKTENDEFW